jgi:hypothetical protein
MDWGKLAQSHSAQSIMASGSKGPTRFLVGRNLDIGRSPFPTVSALPRKADIEELPRGERVVSSMAKSRRGLSSCLGATGTMFLVGLLELAQGTGSGQCL